MEAIIDAIPDIMIEVGLDGFYYFHHYRKDSFIMYGPIYRQENQK
jgi:hypothetical protein